MFTKQEFLDQHLITKHIDLLDPVSAKAFFSSSRNNITKSFLNWQLFTSGNNFLLYSSFPCFESNPSTFSITSSISSFITAWIPSTWPCFRVRHNVCLIYAIFSNVLRLHLLTSYPAILWQCRNGNSFARAWWRNVSHLQNPTNHSNSTVPIHNSEQISIKRKSSQNFLRHRILQGWIFQFWIQPIIFFRYFSQTVLWSAHLWRQCGTNWQRPIIGNGRASRNYFTYSLAFE